jgi:hypothetical protein
LEVVGHEVLDSGVLSEYVFTGRESSIAITQMQFGPAGRAWVVIKGQAAAARSSLGSRIAAAMDVWQALAGTGVAL